jgi:hypothetical protein
VIVRLYYSYRQAQEALLLKKRCFVSEEFGAPGLLRTERLTLQEVDVLCAFAEVLVLHDQVTYFSESVFPSTVQRLVQSLPESRLVAPCGGHLSDIHRLFRSAVDQSLRADLDDLDKALRACRHPLVKGFNHRHVPARARPVTFPPGRPRLSIRPDSAGSVPPPIMTMGIVLVAFFASKIGL